MEPQIDFVTPGNSTKNLRNLFCQLKSRNFWLPWHAYCPDIRTTGKNPSPPCKPVYILAADRKSGVTKSWPRYCKSWDCSICGERRTRFCLYLLQKTAIYFDGLWVAMAPSRDATENVRKHAASRGAEVVIWIARKDEPTVYLFSDTDLTPRRMRKGTYLAWKKMSVSGVEQFGRQALGFPGVQRLRAYGKLVDGIKTGKSELELIGTSELELIGTMESNCQQKEVESLAVKIALEEHAVELQPYGPVPEELVEIWIAALKEAYARLRSWDLVGCCRKSATVLADSVAVDL